MAETINNLLKKAERALQNNETLVALLQLEAALAIKQLPGIKSKLAYCIAKERHQHKQALALCLEALHAEPNNPDHYYQLGRIHLIAGKKHQALKALHKGLKFKRHQPIIDELNRLGFRKEPFFASLPREHFLNRSVGILLAKLGSR